MLQKGADYIRQLRAERSQLRDEMDSLRQQIDCLNTAIRYVIPLVYMFIYTQTDALKFFRIICFKITGFIMKLSACLDY